MFEHGRRRVGWSKLHHRFAPALPRPKHRDDQSAELTDNPSQRPRRVMFNGAGQACAAGREVAPLVTAAGSDRRARNVGHKPSGDML
jgi:hypothetical protein